MAQAFIRINHELVGGVPLVHYSDDVPTISYPPPPLVVGSVKKGRTDPCDSRLIGISRKLGIDI